MRLPVRQRSRRSVHRSSGLTIVELIVFMLVLSVAMAMFSNTVVSVVRQRSINRENAVAADASRSALETLRAEDLWRVYALYNADESDDPDGPGTAPGSRFAVEGLDAVPTAVDGLVGEFLFPGVTVSAPGDPIDLELRENVVDPAFGLPRDLTGNSIIDGADHTNDYLLLPVIVRLRWAGRAGTRQLDTFATLCEYNWP